MGLGLKTSLTLGFAIFVGASLALWLTYSDGVYAAYLSGALMNCI